MANLYPTVDVTAEKRARAVWGVAYRYGFDGDWEDNAALWTFYTNHLNKYLLRTYQIAKHREGVDSVPPESDFSLDD
jgi:hypothetical protein